MIENRAKGPTERKNRAKEAHFRYITVHAAFVLPFSGAESAGQKSFWLHLGAYSHPACT